MTQRVVILGAAGRDFHNFNTYFRDNPDFEVVAFTATQIPDIDGRRYPPELAGSSYPDGIPIEEEAGMERLIRDQKVDIAVFSYSDVSHEQVMHVGSRAMAAGADYMLLGPRHTMLDSKVPVVAVCAARTGAGKSQTSRRVAGILREMGKRVVAVRHPMPYGDLTKQAVQRFADFEDLDKHEVTIEEREEYEPHLRAGSVVYAGVDYERILRQAEQEADVVIWDGGNNDMPFYTPDLLIVVVDPHRPDHAARYHPGEVNVRMADVVVINKVGTAGLEGIETARRITMELNPDATIIEAATAPTFAASACWSSRTAPRSLTARCPTAPAGWPLAAMARPRSWTRAPSPWVPSGTPLRSIPLRGQCSQPWDMGRSRQLSWPRRSTRPRWTSSWSQRRSTCAI